MTPRDVVLVAVCGPLFALAFFALFWAGVVLLEYWVGLV